MHIEIGAVLAGILGLLITTAAQVTLSLVGVRSSRSNAKTLEDVCRTVNGQRQALLDRIARLERELAQCRAELARKR